MSASTAGRKHHATLYCTLLLAKLTARFAFPNGKRKGSQQQQTSLSFWQLWDYSSLAFGSGLPILELVLIKTKKTLILPVNLFWKEFRDRNFAEKEKKSKRHEGVLNCLLVDSFCWTLQKPCAKCISHPLGYAFIHVKCNANADF